MTQAIVTTTDAKGIATFRAGHSVLGESEAKISVGGKIRAGIKVLTATSAKNKRAAEIYNAGLQAGKKWAQIEKEIATECSIPYPLTPRNVPYFTVRRQDFKVHEVADKIMELYATEGPDGRQLYRFPVIWPTDNWLVSIPHQLSVYTRSELVYWSRYDELGKRWCMTHAPLAVDAKAKRAHRPFGGRPIVARADNEGVCDPEKCKEYQEGICNLRGSFVFFVPGIPGASAISLPTTSYYAMEEAKQKLQTVSFITRGRIAGVFDGKPIFWISKTQQEVSMIDRETGKAKRVKQWLITLEADIDMLRVFQAGEQRALGVEARPVALLGDSTERHVGIDDTDDDDAAALLPTTDDEREKIAAARKRVSACMEEININTQMFVRYGDRTWGEDWSVTLASLQAAETLLRKIADEGDAEAMATIKDVGGPL